MTRYDPQKHHRRSIRLKGYDYARAGAYFVTIVTQGRACVFGEVAEGQMQLNDAGRMVEAVWAALPVRFSTLILDAHIIMPNHIHGIIVIDTPEQAVVGASLVDAPVVDAANQNQAGTSPAPTDPAVAPTLGTVVGAFKSISTVEYTRGVKISGWSPFPGKLWQRNYYEHIIRNEADLNRIRRYISENPMRWALDAENPKRTR